VPLRTVPPPATVFPGGAVLPGGAVPVAPGGGNPADAPPSLAPLRSNYPPATDGAAAAPAAGEAQSGQGYTDDGGKTYYYFRGTVKQPFSEQQPATTNGNEVGTGVKKPEVSEPANSLQGPANNVPQNTVPQGFIPPSGPLKVDARPSGIGADVKTTQPDYLSGGRLAPVAPQNPPSNTSKTLHPSIRPLPDPEPNGPANRAPQLLNPRDKTT